MRPPAFWQRPPEAPGWQARLLSPFAAVYASGTARRVAKPSSYQPKIPVVSVGNINVGGTGKTPTVIALTKLLQDRAVHIVSRGYGGDAPGPLRVDPKRHDAATVGDEPLLLSAFAPTWISRDRSAGVALAEDDGAEIVLLDDSHQNPTVPKALSLVVVDAALGFGNGRVLPAGPLREPVETGLSRADMLISLGDDPAQERFDANWGQHVTIPHARGALELLETGMDWVDQPVLAFAGIGHPEKFFRTVRATGANLLRTEALEDHQPLTDALMKRLELEASALNAQLVTTEKDAVRLPPSFRQKVLALPVRLRFAEQAGLNDRLAALFD
ncbi:MAG: tetraacyldisaccharide 4'-kinase [Pseudomonadota bacterium]